MAQEGALRQFTTTPSWSGISRIRGLQAVIESAIGLLARSGSGMLGADLRGHALRWRSHAYSRRVNHDQWRESECAQRADGVQPDVRSILSFERKRLLARIDSERDHITHGTKGADPAPPEEVLAWCEARLGEVDRRLRVLDQEDP